VRIFTSNDEFFARFAELGPGDHFVGRLRFRPGEEVLAVDLVQRGVQFYPSLLSQLLSRSKVLQARILSTWMVPGTTVIYDVHDLHRAMIRAGEEGREGAWITKLDRRDAGLGIHRWRSIEDVLNAASFGSLAFPFVLQPFLPQFTDIRIVVIGDYREAYQRINSANFRSNLHFGGRSRAASLTDEMLAICRAVMERGGFPYGHIDLLRTPEGDIYLSEINLRGGLRGARIDARNYAERIARLHNAYIERHKGEEV